MTDTTAPPTGRDALLERAVDIVRGAIERADIGIDCIRVEKFGGEYLNGLYVTLQPDAADGAEAVRAIFTNLGMDESATTTILGADRSYIWAFIASIGMRVEIQFGAACAAGVPSVVTK